jgi:hypothetical protein
MALDFEELLAKKRPTTVEVTLAMDADVAEAHATALAAYEVARTVAVDNPGQKSAQEALRDAEAALEDASAALEQAVVTFRFQGLGRAEWDALVDEHPATREQKDKARKDNATVPVWNEDTFGPALVAACCIDPVMTYEQVQSLWKSEEWNWAELRDLFTAAYNASRGRRVPQLGKGFGRTLN